MSGNECVDGVWHYGLEATLDRITDVDWYRKGFNEYGRGGHPNILMEIQKEQERGETYCGKPIPEALAEEAMQYWADFLQALEELEREACPEMDEILRKRGRNEWFRWTLLYAWEEGIIPKERMAEITNAGERLMETTYKERFLELGRRLNQFHLNYMEFLRTAAAEFQAGTE